MEADSIRETFLAFFEERDHRRMPSASLIPPPEDSSTMLTVAGMQPFKPYFLGTENPPATRLTSSQACFRTPDIEEVGKTMRHLTFFEMLGNFSFGDYFKEESIPFGWELSVEGFGIDPSLIWVTVFGGDEELGIGPDEESIAIWRELGLPDERIVRLSREENFWQAGPTGPSGPCSEMYLDRGSEFGSDDLRPGDDTDRFLEYWNHVFMTYDLKEDGSVEPLPRRNIDTGMGLERMAAVLQDVPSVFQTDLFSPLVDLAVEMSGIGFEDSEEATRAMRIIADHSRGMTFLLAAGVVPSNEERGYVLRRVMRRAIQQGRTLGLEGDWLERFTDRTIEMMGPAHPLVVDQRERVTKWVRSEGEAFGKTLDRGTELLDQVVERALDQGNSWISADDAFLLHDTYGFPFDLTREMISARGLSVDDQGFEELMEGQRRRARSGAAAGSRGEDHDQLIEFAGSAPETEFVGYETLGTTTGVAAVGPGEGEKALVKLDRSPFYAEGGGQVADSGRLVWDGGSAEVTDVVRIGDDQVVEIGPDSGNGEWVPPEGQGVEAKVDRSSRMRTMANHTATHLLHAALRERLGDHAHQAGSAVTPTKLRFDFTHNESLSAEDVAWIEDRVNGWIKDAEPVRWMVMEKSEAERLGAMALFGEKYGDWVRVVEIEDVSRELCGGTHVANTAEIGIFTITSEGSSAANVRRIEAITGPEAIDWHRERVAELGEVGQLLGDPRDPVGAARRSGERLAEFEAEARKDADRRQAVLATELAEAVGQVGSGEAVLSEVPLSDPKEIIQLAKSVAAERPGAAVVLGGGSPGEGRAGLVVLVPGGTFEGVSASEVISELAPLIGGGGGGSHELAQAGGSKPEGVSEALVIARARLESS
ncbi:MAG: alanine--tRNA ligase [Solirubrobacterales bacterium]